MHRINNVPFSGPINNSSTPLFVFIRVHSWFVVFLPDRWAIPLEPSPSPWWPFVVLRVPSWIPLFRPLRVTLNGYNEGKGTHSAAETCVLQSNGIGAPPVLGLTRSKVLASGRYRGGGLLLPGRDCT